MHSDCFTHHFRGTFSSSGQTNWLLDRSPKCRWDIFPINPFQPAATQHKLLSTVSFRLSTDSWIEYDLHISCTIYDRDIYNRTSYYKIISYFRHILVCNNHVSLTLRFVKTMVRWRCTIGSRIYMFNKGLAQWLCQLFRHQIELICATILATGMPGYCITALALFENISSANLNCVCGFSSDWSHDSWMVTLR